MALARRFGGEIVSCDSTAVYRGFDIGTDKVPPDEQRASRTIWSTSPSPPRATPPRATHATPRRSCAPSHGRGRLPDRWSVGTGFCYGALSRGLFPGPAADAALRARLEEIAARRGRRHAFTGG